MTDGTVNTTRTPERDEARKTPDDVPSGTPAPQERTENASEARRAENQAQPSAAPIDEQYASLETAIREYNPQADFDLIRGAYEFAKEQHNGQLRKSGEPYIIHPVAVARIIADLKLDSESIAAALLHDVIEDTPATPRTRT